MAHGCSARARACLFLLLSFAATAAAQPAPARAQKTEWFGGYSYLRDPGNAVLAATGGDDVFPLGWFAGGAHRVWRSVALVAEASGNYKSGVTLEDDVSFSFHAILGGPRAALRIGPASGFTQALVGVAHGRGSGFGTTVSVTDLSVQPGGGVDYPIGSRLAGRVEVDYRWIRGAGEREAANQIRVAAGVVFR